MKKQTAVEWLKEIYDSCNNYEKFIANIDWEQAKQMEKEQIELAHIDGGKNKRTAVKYYNETFKSE